MAGKRKVTKYQRLQKAATAHCKTGSTASRKRLASAEKAYRADALKKGKKAAEIKATIARLKKCPTK